MTGAAEAVVTACLFAKPPVAGAVKTRLAAAVGAAGAARLARAFLLDSVAALVGVPRLRLVLATTGELDPDLLAALGGPPVWPQGDGDLGARLERVLRRGLGHGGPVLALGADSPGLPPGRIASAMAALDDADAVLGRCDDGGFYLLGVRACPEGLLERIPWSTAETAHRTVERLTARGFMVSEIAGWFDVDRPEDLSRLWSLAEQAPERLPHTRAALAELGVW